MIIYRKKKWCEEDETIHIQSWYDWCITRLVQKTHEQSQKRAFCCIFSTKNAIFTTSRNVTTNDLMNKNLEEKKNQLIENDDLEKKTMNQNMKIDRYSYYIKFSIIKFTLSHCSSFISHSCCRIIVLRPHQKPSSIKSYYYEFARH
jgi:hypothetical protein